MDRYDRVIHDIQQRTAGGALDWKVVQAHHYDSILLNPDRVIRVFHSDYSLGERKYRLLFVDRKVEYHDEFGDAADGYGSELFVLDEDGEVVLPLSEGIVDRDDLSKLAGLIAQHNDRAREFFDAFERPGVA